MANGAVGNMFGSANTLSGGADYKEKANQNAAKKRKVRNPKTPPERFVMPGQQQMQAQQQAQQQRFTGPQMNTFANMQKQGMARPAPPPAAGPAQAQPAPTVQRVANAMNTAAPVQPNPALQQQVQQTMAAGQQVQPQQPALVGQVQQQLGQMPQQPVQQIAVQPMQQQAMQPQTPMQQQAPVQPMQQQAQPQPDLQARLLEQLTGLTSNLSAYESEDIQQMREAQRADLQAQFGAQRQQIEEELARRGLSASSIAAGQFGDLAGQQARALATMEAGLTEKAAESLQRGREAAIQGLAQAAGIQIQSQELDLQSKKVQADIEAETKRLMQADRSLDLQSARDKAQQSIAYAQLKEQAASRVSRENLTIAQMQQDQKQFADRMGLDRDKFDQDVAYQAEQIRLQDKSIDATTAHNLAMQELQRDTLNQRVAEAKQQAEQFGLQFESDQAETKWIQDWIMSQAEAMGAGSGGQSNYNQPNYPPVYPPNYGGGGGGYPNYNTPSGGVE